MKNHYRPADFNEGNTYNERTERFVGVDLTSPQMQVDLKHGVSSKNYMLNPNGKVQKRFAYEQISDGTIVLGVWDFVCNGAVKRVAYVVNGSSRFFVEPKKISEKYVVFSYVSGVADSATPISGYSELDDALTRKQVYATASNNKLWVLTGNEFVVIYFDSLANALKASAVRASPFVHVPVVTYAGIASNATTVPDNSNITLENPNLLSQYRKDMFLLGNGVSGYIFPKFNLGKKCANTNLASISGKIEYLRSNATETMIETAITTNLVAATLPVSLIANDSTVDEQAEMEELLKAGTIILTTEEGKTYYESLTADSVTADKTFTSVLVTGQGAVAYQTNVTAAVVTKEFALSVYTRYPIYGIVRNTDESTEVVIFNDFKPAITAKPNITIKYKWCTDEVYADNISFIKKCTFGTRFGANNAINRLWLAGNKDKPNYAIHSEEPYLGLSDNANESIDDFGYFSDEAYIRFGEAGNPVIGMEIVSTDKLAIIKGKFGGDRSMYLVTPQVLEQKVIDEVNIIKELYSTSVSNTSTAGYSKYTVTNFNGDLLFLSNEKQIVGLDIEGISGDSQRVANTRSYFVDGALRGENLENAKLFHTDNGVFLATEKAVYASLFNSFDSESRQYQWWALDSIPVSPMSISVLEDGEVWIGGSDGKVYRFAENKNGFAFDTDRIYLHDSSDNPDITISSNTYFALPQEVFNKLPVMNPNPMKKAEGLALLAIPSQTDCYITDSKSMRYLLNHDMFVFMSTYYMGINVIINGNTVKFVSKTGTAIPSDLSDILYAKDKYELGYGELARLSYVKSSDPTKNFYVNFARDLAKRRALIPVCYFAEKIGATDYRALVYGTNDSKLLYWLSDGTVVQCNSSEYCKVKKVYPEDEILQEYGYEKTYFQLIDLTTGEPRHNSNDTADYGDEFIDDSGTIRNPYWLITMPEDDIYLFKEGSNAVVQPYYRKSGSGDYVKFAICKNIGTTAKIPSYIEFRKPIQSEFVSLRLTQGKIGYEKVIDNITIWNDSKSPSELYVGMLTNKQMHTYETNKVIDPGMSFDFGEVDFEHTTFDKNNVPSYYNLKRFSKNQQSFSIVFKSPSERESVLSGLDILYKIRKANKMH